MTASPISWAPGGSTPFPQLSHTHRIHAFPYHLKPLPLRAFPFLIVIRRLLTVPSLSQSILFVSLHLKSNPFSNRLRTTQTNSIPFRFRSDRIRIVTSPFHHWTLLYGALPYHLDSGQIVSLPLLFTYIITSQISTSPLQFFFYSKPYQSFPAHSGSD